ncbi:hypothetical protein SLA2020_365480 [Shorea laevis]
MIDPPPREPSVVSLHGLLGATYSCAHQPVGIVPKFCFVASSLAQSRPVPLTHLPMESNENSGLKNFQDSTSQPS